MSTKFVVRLFVFKKFIESHYELKTYSRMRFESGQVIGWFLIPNNMGVAKNQKITKVITVRMFDVVWRYQ